MRRRDFLKVCAAAPAAASLSGRPADAAPGAGPYDSKGLPTRALGRTGTSVPAIGIGCGTRFCAVKDPEQSVAILNAALDHGFYYWDTASQYASQDGSVVSEERLGLVLKDRRREVFLASKVHDRTYDGARRLIEQSLKRLNTDRLDLLQIHAVGTLDEVERVGRPDGVLRALREARDEKVTRFLGFSGHLSAAAMTEMARRYDFDTMLIALNHYGERQGDFEGQAVPAATAKGLAVMVIKTIRPREKDPSLRPEELLRYALSLDHVSAAVVGTDSVEVVRKNADLLRTFKKMTPEEMSRIAVKVKPLFAARSFDWQKPGYCDGVPG